MRIRIFWIGKTQNAPIKSLISDYLDRLRHMAPVEIHEAPDFSKRRGLTGASLLAAERTEIDRFLAADSRKVVLDEQGAQLTSTEFARWIEAAQIQGVREVSFIIGGPAGLDPALREQAHFRLSLGRMTWTHEMARVLLLEQIYRAFSILRNIPYHK
jgi:23S rRNA (pseudouridine1915-N3)-methyltransferase